MTSSSPRQYPVTPWRGALAWGGGHGPVQERRGQVCIQLPPAASLTRSPLKVAGAIRCGWKNKPSSIGACQLRGPSPNGSNGLGRLVRGLEGSRRVILVGGGEQAVAGGQDWAPGRATGLAVKRVCWGLPGF